MLDVGKPVFVALNHLLKEETWAQDRLRVFAGAKVLIEAGPITLDLLIDEHGLFRHGEQSQQPDVTLTLPADMAFKLVFDRQNLFSTVKIAGSADIAETLAFVFRNLRWDAEAGLANLIGDIPARRLAMFGARLGSQIFDNTRRLTENVVEYTTEDSHLLVPNHDIQVLRQAVNDLRDDVARLETRIARL
jgi:ubiquinone biosynthesis accessory factor UbiJ